MARQQSPMAVEPRCIANASEGSSPADWKTHVAEYAGDLSREDYARNLRVPQFRPTETDHERRALRYCLLHLLGVADERHLGTSVHVSDATTKRVTVFSALTYLSVRARCHGDSGMRATLAFRNQGASPCVGCDSSSPEALSARRESPWMRARGSTMSSMMQWGLTLQLTITTSRTPKGWLGRTVRCIQHSLSEVRRRRRGQIREAGWADYVTIAVKDM